MSASTQWAKLRTLTWVRSYTYTLHDGLLQMSTQRNALYDCLDQKCRYLGGKGIGKNGKRLYIREAHNLFWIFSKKSTIDFFRSIKNLKCNSPVWVIGLNVHESKWVDERGESHLQKIEKDINWAKWSIIHSREV